MGVGSFFKLPSYNVFDYKPRFYNPEEEERKEKLKILRQEKDKPTMDSDLNEYKPGSTIKGSFRPRMTRKSYKNYNYTVRLLVIIAALFFLAYILLVADLTSLIKIFSR